MAFSLDWDLHTLMTIDAIYRRKSIAVNPRA